MFKWSDRYCWHFTDGGIQDGEGINDSNTNMFKGQPYKGLAKEMLQNSMDAKDPRLGDDVPVKVVFEKIEVPSECIPGANRLIEVTELCRQKYSDGDNGEKTAMLADYAKKHLKPGKTIPVLRISDYNTTGANGVHETEKTNWARMVRERGSTPKIEGAAGSHGVGKNAAYAFANMRTVLYVTKSDYEPKNKNLTGPVETAFQGKAIFTTFVENGKKKMPMTVFGAKESEEADAVFDFSDIPDVFKRYENGTDVIAVGFESKDSWKESIAISVLQYYFYAIYKGCLVVEIRDSSEPDQSLVIDKAVLKAQMKYFKQFVETHPEMEDANFKFDAPDFYDVLEDFANNNKEPIVQDFYGKGEVELYLLLSNEYPDKKVYEMRDAGMLVTKDTSFSYPANFRAIFVATGNNAKSLKPEDNINSFLRRCEDQAHNIWSPNYYEGHEQEAKKLISGIHSFVLENVKKQMPRVEEEVVDAFGLSDLIPDQYRNGDNDQEEEAFGDLQPLSLSMKKKRGKKGYPLDLSSPSNARGKKNGRKKPDPAKNPNIPGNPNPNNRQGKRKTKAIQIESVSSPYDKEKNAYSLAFLITSNVKNAQINLSAGGDESTEELEINKVFRDGKELLVNRNTINVGEVNANELVELEVYIRETVRCALEVKMFDKS